MEIDRIGDVALGWGESLVWDDRTGRLSFVDCAASALHWLEDGVGAVGVRGRPEPRARIEGRHLRR